MRVLLVHNRYRSSTPSGENRVFEAERDLLAAAGHVVETWTRDNDEIATSPLRTVLSATLLAAHNPASAAAFRRHARAFRPDVVHVHNTFPLISPAILPVAGETGAAVVATLHNYRLVCAQGGYLRGQRLCTECLDRSSSLPAIAHGCYRGHLASVPVAAGIAWHRRAKTWSRYPHALIALTEFQKSMVVRAGIPASRLHVKSNFSGDGESTPWADRQDSVVFVGRVSPEKGVDTLIEAWNLLGKDAPPLRVVGAGESLATLRARVAELGLSGRIRFDGQLAHADAMRVLADARLLVFPSRWYEPFGMALVEAYARGVPVLASRLGSLPDLVPEGVCGALFEPGRAESLAQTLRALWASPARLESMSATARRIWAERYTPAANLARLESIYVQAAEAARAQTH